MRRLLARVVGTILALAIVSSLASAADATRPAESAEAQAAPAAEVAELGGAWRKSARGPFGAVDMPGGWTGTELVVVDPEQKRRAAAYYPALDSWRTIARPSWKVRSGSRAHWIGSELLFVEPRGSARRGLPAYDPVADRWRSTATAPMNDIAASVWAGDVLVAASGSGRASAVYDPLSDAWTELPPMPVPEATTDTGTMRPVSLHWSGERVYALVAGSADADAPGVDAEAKLAFAPLDLDEGTWAEPVTGPLAAGTAEPLWTGDSFVFLTNPHNADVAQAGPPRDGRYDPDGDTWTVVENGCGIDTSGAVWTGTHIIDVPRRRAFDPASGRCYALPLSPWPERSGALSAWTGREMLELSGTTRSRSRARRDGVAYAPVADDGSLGVAVDKPSRPVRVRIPSLGIDLPVIWDGRRVKGSSPGYPACDVALYWSAFDLPGEPGTTWILAHAQQGMFLPLLDTLRARGTKSLLGRRVELQLRDGRLFTYRTYKVNPRAGPHALGIATKGRRKGEHRLVLQTSTGTGSDPKLQVAARLVDVATTDEPRPRPKPRACG